MYMSVFACMYVFMYVHHVRTWWMQRSEEGVPYPGTGVTDHPLASDLVPQLTIPNLNPAFTESTRCRPPAVLARVTGQGLSTARDHRTGPASVFELLSSRPPPIRSLPARLRRALTRVLARWSARRHLFCDRRCVAGRDEQD